MKSTSRMKENILAKKLKKEDPIELPMDEKFFENLHDQIMKAVEKTEVKPLSRWAKTWVFLETNTVRSRAMSKKIVKTSFVGLVLATGFAFFALSAKMYSDVYVAQNQGNQTKIVNEATKSPMEWSELVVSYQNENDFYADILSQKNDLGTIVEIDRVLTGSL
ncbi:MAG: hypothetical protein H7328_03805 [Bdellovibrio sp.]|nr:hypothetical protein [Bdellovibrio sp.]